VLAFHRLGLDWRRSTLAAAIAWAVWLTALTETLGAARLLTVAAVASAWVAATVVSAFILTRVRPADPPPPNPSPPAPSKAVLWALGLAVALVGVAALAGAPTNWDALSYHLPRVMHWIQNASVDHYPTHILRQLHQAPWSEFAVMHLQLLSGGDRLANTIQWLALLGTAVGVSVVAEQLGGGPPAQLLSAVFYATVPMAVLEGSNPKNDEVLSFWVVCGAVATLDLVAGKDAGRPRKILLFAAAAGLAVLTKATAYVFLAPLLVWILAARIAHRGRELRAFGPGILIFVALNAGHYSRNAAVYGSPIGPVEEGTSHLRYVNEAFGPAQVASNLARNLALQLETPLEGPDRLIEAAVRAFHRLIGADPDDPRTSWNPFRLSSTLVNADRAGSPFHVVLIAAALVLAAKGLRDRRMGAYAIVCGSACVLFAAVLKWQPWHSRLHLPLFALWAPFVGVVLGARLAPRATAAVATLLLLSAAPWVLANGSHPLCCRKSVLVEDRLTQYFTNDPDLQRPYEQAARRVLRERCGQIGLVSDADSWEYPLWKVFEQPKVPVRIEHVLVTNESSRKAAEPPYRDFQPCAVLSLRREEMPTALVGGRLFLRSWSLPEIQLLLPRR
jgi:hypothetical protein